METLPSIEQYWDFSEEKLTAVLDRIVRDVQPERIYIFGSRARGDNKPHSDMDIAVVMPVIDAEHPRPEMNRISSDFFLDLNFFVMDLKKLEEWGEWANTVEGEILRDGVLLYEKRTGKSPDRPTIASLASRCRFTSPAAQ